MAVALPETWTELVDQTRARDPSESRYPVPWGPVQLDSGIWLARSAQDQDREAGRKHAEFSRLARDVGARRGSWPDRLRAVVGVGEACRWTRGETRRAPVNRCDLPVTGAVIASELSVAVGVIRDRADGWQEATGAFVWLRWLTGEDDTIRYPLW